jgi:CRP-like cAMP-binding protein
VNPVEGDGGGVQVYDQSPVSYVELLARTDFFADAESATLAKLAAESSEVTLRRNDVVFTEGDTPDALYMVIKGRLALVNSSPDGRESVLALMERGDLFGEMGLLDDRPRSATARALENSTLLRLPYAPVEAVLEASPSLLWGVVKLLAGRIRNMDEALADSVFLDVTGRTAKRLLELSEGHDEFTLPLTQEELAGMVGASRERVNKAISSFIRLGWLDQSDRRYKIVQRDRLEMRAR